MARADFYSATLSSTEQPSDSTSPSSRRQLAVKPAGEWNTFEITSRGRDMTLWVNGAVTNEWHECDVPKGYLGLEAEGYRIEFRNVKVKPLDETSTAKTDGKSQRPDRK